jgi:formamidopyrimidine-DNA glycosylase
MPELPEVETVRRQLADSVAGLTFASVERVEPAMLLDCDEGEVRAELPGRHIESVERLGKFIIVRLGRDADRPAFVTLHLGMTGQLLVDPSGASAHTRFLFRLRSGEGGERVLEFRDTRKFGRVHLTLDGPAPRLALLGPDAWLGDWDETYLERRLGRRTAPIKASLLDQRILAGIGNIYADETLWWSQISPLRESGSLTAEEVARLAGEIRRRLSEGVRFLGCSFSDFVDTAGREGSFQDWLRAYGKQGERCSRCGGVFARVIVAGRGTSYCPQCQG